MKCSTFRKESLGTGELTEACLAHVQQCSDCRDLYEQGRALRELLALKRYEKIPGDSLDQTRRAFRVAVAEPAETPGYSVAQLLRYALAGAFVMLLVMNFSVGPELPAIQPPAQEARSVAAAPAMAFPGPYLAHSNAEPAGIQYGPLPSRLVNFNY
ncbi:MAG: hypothetical protein AB7T27_02875 [Kiritimatiellia bacterium]